MSSGDGPEGPRLGSPVHLGWSGTWSRGGFHTAWSIQFGKCASQEKSLIYALPHSHICLFVHLYHKLLRALCGWVMCLVSEQGCVWCLSGQWGCLWEHLTFFTDRLTSSISIILLLWGWHTGSTEVFKGPSTDPSCPIMATGGHTLGGCCWANVSCWMNRFVGQSSF